MKCKNLKEKKKKELLEIILLSGKGLGLKHKTKVDTITEKLIDLTI